MTIPSVVAAGWLSPLVWSMPLALAGGMLFLVLALHRRGMLGWVGSYARSHRRRRSPAPGQTIHVLICIADHFEPQNGHVPPDQARARVEAWVQNYPRLFSQFRDSDGRPPRHTFFFPIDEYDADHLDAIAGLCRQGFGEVEVHHHHHHDTGEALRERLLRFKQLFRERHGLLASNKVTSEVMYGFVHGNWALDNSRPDGCWCGVNNELDILRETGCYADFTMPSAPSPTQTRKLNSIYYAVDDPLRPKSHDCGVDAACGSAPPGNSLLLIQGPLILNWRNRKFGLLPRVENGNLQGPQPPRIQRLDDWLRASVQVGGRPDWYFVKLYTHGATEANQAAVLGEPMVRFHQALAQRAHRDSRFHYHYVTAREMYNLAKAAEGGWQAGVAEARDHVLAWSAVSGGESGAGLACSCPQSTA